MKEYLPPTENVRRRRYIAYFEHKNCKTLSDAWNKFKRLVRNCQNNNRPQCVQMENFNDGLNISSQQAAYVATLEPGD